MALSPNEQALTEQEIVWADELEKDIDGRLQVAHVAEKLQLDIRMPANIPRSQQHRVQSEVLTRYRNVGWEIKEDWRGFIFIRPT